MYIAWVLMHILHVGRFDNYVCVTCSPQSVQMVTMDLIARKSKSSHHSPYHHTEHVQLSDVCTLIALVMESARNRMELVSVMR